MEFGGRDPEDVSSLSSLLLTTRPEIVERARDAWPEVQHPAELFLLHVAEKLPPGTIDAALEALHTNDLYLACACAAGSPRAIEAFDRECLPEIDRAVARLDGGERIVDDVRQIVRELVLLRRDPEPPRIADFSGRSRLSGWLRVIAVREAVRLLQRDKQVISDDHALAEALDPGPELSYFKKLYRAEFRAALTEAIQGLTDRQKVMLRQNTLDGVSIDRLAALYGVHRATAARWLVTAREDLVVATREALRRRLVVSQSEVESIMRLIQSQLDVTLRTLLPS